MARYLQTLEMIPGTDEGHISSAGNLAGAGAVLGACT